ncbi:MAG: ribbon-helix-helix domain-containing protein [Bacillota bacterium]
MIGTDDDRRPDEGDEESRNESRKGPQEHGRGSGDHGRGHRPHGRHQRGMFIGFGDGPGIHVEGPEGLRMFATKLREGLGHRANVVMVRVNEEVLEKLEDLVEAGIFKSQSESAAFLIQEGIKTQDALFQKITDHTKRIRELRQELKDLVNREPTKAE